MKMWLGWLTAAALLASAPAAVTPAELYKDARRIMGTFCEVQVYHADADVAR